VAKKKIERGKFLRKGCRNKLGGRKVKDRRVGKREKKKIYLIRSRGCSKATRLKGELIEETMGSRGSVKEKSWKKMERARQK